MTSWTRKQVGQHKELRTPKYRQRVVPLEKKEILEKVIEEETKQEIEKMKHELDFDGT